MKITRKQLRSLIQEQTTELATTGPFLVVVVNKEDSEVTQAFIVKQLPGDHNWWHFNGGEYTGDDIIHIFDMSSKRIDQKAFGASPGRIIFNKPPDIIYNPD